jgi:hypothetical protein
MVDIQQVWENNDQYYNILYLLPNNVLQKTKLNILEDTVSDKLHNSTDNRPEAIARIELFIKVLQIFFNFWAVGGQGWVHLWLIFSKCEKIMICKPQ